MVSTAAAWQCRSQLKVDVDGHGQEVMWNVENVGYPACLTLQSLLTILLYATSRLLPLYFTFVCSLIVSEARE
jgi:hypothetical protein